MGRSREGGASPSSSSAAGVSPPRRVLQAVAAPQPRHGHHQQGAARVDAAAAGGHGGRDVDSPRPLNAAAPAEGLRAPAGGASSRPFMLMTSRGALPDHHPLGSSDPVERAMLLDYLTLVKALRGEDAAAAAAATAGCLYPQMRPGAPASLTALFSHAADTAISSLASGGPEPPLSSGQHANTADAPASGARDQERQGSERPGQLSAAPEPSSPQHQIVGNMLAWLRGRKLMGAQPVSQQSALPGSTAPLAGAPPGPITHPAVPSTNEAVAAPGSASNNNVKIWIQPSGPRQPGLGTEDAEQGILSAETMPSNGDVVLRITLLAAGFVIGPSGVSIREVMRESNADIKSWTEQGSHNKAARPARVFLLSGEPESVAQAIYIICSAVDRYKELCEGRYKGQAVSHGQQVLGVEFFYQPPPKTSVPNAASLRGTHPLTYKQGHRAAAAASGLAGTRGPLLPGCGGTHGGGSTGAAYPAAAPPPAAAYPSMETFAAMMAAYAAVMVPTASVLAGMGGMVPGMVGPYGPGVAAGMGPGMAAFPGPAGMVPIDPGAAAAGAGAAAGSPSGWHAGMPVYPAAGLQFDGLAGEPLAYLPEGQYHPATDALASSSAACISHGPAGLAGVGPAGAFAGADPAPHGALQGGGSSSGYGVQQPGDAASGGRHTPCDPDEARPSTPVATAAAGYGGYVPLPPEQLQQAGGGGGAGGAGAALPVAGYHWDVGMPALLGPPQPLGVARLPGMGLPAMQPAVGMVPLSPAPAVPPWLMPGSPSQPVAPLMGPLPGMPPYVPASPVRLMATGMSAVPCVEVGGCTYFPSQLSPGVPSPDAAGVRGDAWRLLLYDNPYLAQQVIGSSAPRASSAAPSNTSSSSRPAGPGSAAVGSTSMDPPPPPPPHSQASGGQQQLDREGQPPGEGLMQGGPAAHPDAAADPARHSHAQAPAAPEGSQGAPAHARQGAAAAEPASDDVVQGGDQDCSKGSSAHAAAAPPRAACAEGDRAAPPASKPAAGGGGGAAKTATQAKARGFAAKAALTLETVPETAAITGGDAPAPQLAHAGSPCLNASDPVVSPGRVTLAGKVKAAGVQIPPALLRRPSHTSASSSSSSAHQQEVPQTSRASSVQSRLQALSHEEADGAKANEAPVSG